MEHVFFMVVGFLMAVLLGQIIIPRILVISLRKRLFDQPDSRKVHHRPISRLGGVTFFPVILIVMCTIGLLQFYEMENITSSVISESLCLVAGLMLLYMIGVCDDLIGVRYRRKFEVQILAAAFLPFAGLSIQNLGGLFGWYEISPLVGVPLTMLLTVFLINAINLIDGIDGLASGLCMVAITLFGMSFALHGSWMYALLAFASVGVLIPFFFYNVFGNANRGHKIFMGDTGSLTLGFILSVMVVKYVSVMVQESSRLDGAPVVMAFSVLLVPSLDVCRVVLNRFRRRVHPFKPDKSHIHHKFLNMGFTPRRSMILIQLMAVAFIVLTLVLLRIGLLAPVVFILDILVWTLMNVWFSRIISRRA
jgi:UDP-N-acetylmuramyl pentapeptide phosphotransferase/UDP-N-acetylglucosamine-1-phosphate transferase